MIEPLRQLIRYREAIRTLVLRDLTVRYSNSILGVVWSLLSPLLMMLVFSLVFTFLVPTGIAHYPVYILAGLLPWNFLTGSTIGAVTSIVANGTLISRVYFPRDILPIAVVLSNLVNFLLALVMLFALLFAYRVPVGLSLVALPLVILIQCLFNLGLGLFLSALNVRFRDTQQVVDVLVLAWFFMTPIIYPLELIANPVLQLLIRVANPMASLVVSYRDILYSGRMPDWGLLAITVAEVIVLLIFGYWFFQWRSPNFVEEL